MSIWNREVSNSFDKAFDFNRDGKLDYMEQALQFEEMERLEKEYWGEPEDSDLVDEDDD